MENKNYAFLGTLIPENEYEMVLGNSKKSMQDAANALQWHFYNGLCQNTGAPIKIINVLPVYSWPQYYKKAWINSSHFKTSYSRNNMNIGFLNIKGFRKWFKTRGIYKALIEWCSHSEGKKNLFVYTLSNTFMKAISKVKRRYPELEVCVIIADLPNMRNLSSNKNPMYAFWRKAYAKKTYSFLDDIDYYVLLTKHMAEYMNLKKPYCVIEGIGTKYEEFGAEVKIDAKYKTIMYAGTLHKRFGVDNLIDAFMKIPFDNYRLIVCGTGDYEEEICKAAKEDNRINFLGQLPRRKVLELQKKSNVVVNPRQNIEEFTKYSFPSKNLECLSAGVPLIAYKLDGIPNEYDEFIFYVADNSVSALSRKIIEVCELPEDEIILYQNKVLSFILNEKNEVIQTKKIVDLMNLVE